MTSAPRASIARRGRRANEATKARYDTGIQKCCLAVSGAANSIEAYMMLQYAAAAVAARRDISDETAQECFDKARDSLDWESSH
jgi:hypothetical protein